MPNGNYCSRHTLLPDNYVWWRHQMETFSALLAFCAGNSPVTGEFPVQRLVTRSFDVSLICAWTNGWVNNRDIGDWRRNRAHYIVIVISNRYRFVKLLSFDAVWYCCTRQSYFISISTIVPYNQCQESNHAGYGYIGKCCIRHYWPSETLELTKSVFWSKRCCC